MGSVFFQDTLSHKFAVTALSKVSDGIRTVAEHFKYRVLSAVSTKGVAVVQHSTDLLSPILYTNIKGDYKNQFRSFRR